jgi:hypothetical protein
MRKPTFELYGINGEFEAFANDDHWNGWECPLFTREEGLRFVEAWNAQGKDEKASGRGEALYDSEHDRFEFTLGREVDTFEPQMVEGLKPYPIRAYGWCWEECE